MLDKYILVNPEKYNASFKQSMSTGKFFFEFSIKASSKKELFDEIEEIIQGLTKIANKYNLVGWVKNNPLNSGEVLGEVEGEEAKIMKFFAQLQEGPTYAKVEHLEIKELPIKNQETYFQIIYEKY